MKAKNNWERQHSKFRPGTRIIYNGKHGLITQVRNIVGSRDMIHVDWDDMTSSVLDRLNCGNIEKEEAKS